MGLLWNALRRARYALPQAIGRVAPGPGPGAALRISRRLHRRGLAASIGYFQADAAGPGAIAAANLALVARLNGQGGNVQLSVKAPPLAFDPARLGQIAAAADAAGAALMFDSHALNDAGPTHAACQRLLSQYPRTGLVLPARWRRSLADAARFRDTPARIRIVKGEWADPEGDEDEVESNFLRLVAALAGRTALVAVATHDPALAERALALLLAAGTPCELEQLRGLPRRRTMAIARRLGVPVRVYVPFGPGWWPYALDRALSRPHLPIWWLKDWAPAI
ncbi:MAG: proline dehydrogenase family protein [Sphingosinicella sp.]